MCAAPGPARTLCLVHPPEQHAPCLCMRRALHWEGNGQHDPVQGFLSIRLALIPLGSVKWMGLKQLPEKGHFTAGAHCSVPQGRLGSPREEGAACPTYGCSPACLSIGGEQIRDILTFNLGTSGFGHPALIPPRSLYHSRRKPKPSGNSGSSRAR